MAVLPVAQSTTKLITHRTAVSIHLLEGMKEMIQITTKLITRRTAVIIHLLEDMKERILENLNLTPKIILNLKWVFPLNKMGWVKWR